MKAPTKTNAARILDRLKIDYSLVEYPVDPENLEASHVAETLGQPIERVYKTLVLKGDRNGFLVCVLAGDRHVDLKKAAKVSGNKKVEMIPMKSLLETTGYIRGGCTAIGMKKHFPTFIDSPAAELDYFYVSAGQRGLQLRLSPLDLQKAAQAQFADISTDQETE